MDDERMISRDLYFQSARIIVLAMAIVSLGGCGGSDRPKTIPITGRVTLNGQPPGEVGKLFFTPTQAAAGYDKRPASAGFTAEGTYRVMSWEPDDGLVPGHYTVSLMPGDMNATKIPKKYQQAGTSGLEVDIPIDQDKVEFNIDVVTK
jgi:hypothetical protein